MLRAGIAITDLANDVGIGDTFRLEAKDRLREADSSNRLGRRNRFVGLVDGDWIPHPDMANREICRRRATRRDMHYSPNRYPGALSDNGTVTHKSISKATFFWTILGRPAIKGHEAGRAQL